MWLLAALGAVIAIAVMSSQSSSANAEMDAYLGMATAYAYLDSAPTVDSVIEVDLKSLAGPPLSLQKVRVVGPIQSNVTFPDGRVGHAALGGLSDDSGHPYGTATLYFI